MVCCYFWNRSFVHSARLMTLNRAKTYATHRMMTSIAITVLSGIAALPLVSATAIAATPHSNGLTSDQCSRLSNQISTTELRDQLDELGIVPQENQIASDLTGLTWIGDAGTFFSATLRRDRVEQVVCQSASAIDIDPEAANSNETPNVFCAQIELNMTLAEVQQVLGSSGEELIGEDGFPLNNIRQWTDLVTQQMAIVSFNNFGEMAGLSCFNPVTIAPNPESESNPDTTTPINPDTL